MLESRLVVLVLVLSLPSCSGGDLEPPDSGTDADHGDADGVDADAPADGDIDADADSDVDLPDGDLPIDADLADTGTDADGDVEVDTDDESPTDADIDEEEPPLFDLDLIRDATAADCQFTDHRLRMSDAVLLDVWSVSYNSVEVVDGVVQPIRMRAFAARPTGGRELPGVVQAHGLGGYAEEEHATGTAALLGMFVIAFTGPGGGSEPENSSEGLPSGHDDGRRMFDTIPDRRGSWFWAHAVAAMRALTCLEHHDDVDPTRLGMTGFSAGGVVPLV